MMNQVQISAYTLIELLTTLFLVGLLTMMSVTSFSYLLNQTEGKTSLKKLQLALQLTRQFAITYQQNMVLCASVDQKTCSGRWDQGYLIQSSDKEIVQVFTGHSWGNLSLHGFATHDPQITIHPNGQTMQNGHFLYRPILNFRAKTSYLCINKVLKTYIAEDGCV